MKFLSTSTLFALFLASSEAFQAPLNQVNTPTSTALHMDDSSPTLDIPYGETSRQYRRTVYTHDDWVKHRSPDRFLRNLASIPASGIYKVSVSLSC